MSNFPPSGYKHCRGCGEEMPGVHTYELRPSGLCDGCGGNKSAYNELNPKPKTEGM